MNLSKRTPSHIIHPQPFSLYQFPLILFSMTLAHPTGSPNRPIPPISPAHSQPLTAQFLPSALPISCHQPCPFPAISPAHFLPSALLTSSHQPCPFPPISPAHFLPSARPISSHQPGPFPPISPAHSRPLTAHFLPSARPTPGH